MKVVVNGEEKEIPDGLTVEELLSQLNICKERVAVELNLDIAPKGRFDDTILKDGDRIEIVSFVGGG
ncbi:MAG: sulfur carrier protein ThiS [Deltaproteobacteria bacterium]|nr:sulfur carrier protein ThiS [Deltaproteobacteria bacterium]